MSKVTSWVKKPFQWMKKHKKVSIAGIVILLVLVFLFRPKPPIPPDTETIKKGDLIQSVAVSGSIDSQTKVDLTFPVGGQVVYIGAQKGDMVNQYQTIAALDQRTLEENIKNAVKSYENQKIQYDIVNVFNGNRALTDLSLSTSAYQQLLTAVNTLDQAQIAVEIQKIAKEQAFLISPINGILTRADITVPGVTASPSTTYTVADPTQLRFKMEVDEADIGKIQPGQRVKIVLDAFPDDTLESTVTDIDFVSHTTSNGGNSFNVETPLATNSAYRIGINGNAEIITGEKDDVLIVPLAALVNDTYVYIKTPQGYEKQKIKLGLENDVEAEVVSGLHAGDVVVTQPSKLPVKK